METITLEVGNLLSFTAAARLLNVSRPTIYNLVARHRLHPLTIGRNRYLLREELENLKELLKPKSKAPLGRCPDWHKRDSQGA